MGSAKDQELMKAVEAILFMADEIVPVTEVAQLLEIPGSEVERLLRELASEYEGRGSGLVLREVAGGWRMATDPSVASYLEKFVNESRSARMSQAALETLAIVAYRQPVSRGQIAEIRGVSSEGVLRTLLLRGVVEEVGRDEGPGQAILYGTTPVFLERMGLKAIEDLPPLGQFMPDTAAVDRMEAGLGPGV